MNSLTIFDSLLNIHWQYAIGALIAIALWVACTLIYSNHKIIKYFPITLAVADFILFTLAVIFCGNLIRALIQELGAGEINSEIRFVTLVCCFIVIGWGIAHTIEVTILKKSRAGVKSALPGLQRFLLYGGCYLICLIVFLHVNNFSGNGVYFTTGAAAAIAAFAAQRTLGDFFSGIALSIESPFNIGDYIRLNDGTEGQVIDINWRATHIRGWDNATNIIPNGGLALQGFKNLHGADHKYAPWYEIKVSADLDPLFVKALLFDAALRCSKVLKYPFPVVRLINASTVPYIYTVWVHFKNYPDMFAGREQLYRELHYALKRAGIKISPEIHEIQTRKADISNIEPPTALLALKSLDLAINLTDEELEMIASMSQRIHFDSGKVILHGGEMSESIDIIINGFVDCSIKLPNGSEKTVDRLSAGEYFGITSMFTSDPSTLQFTATSDLTVLRINRDSIQTLLTDRPDRSEEYARLVKQRLDLAENFRQEATLNTARLSIQDIVHRIEGRLNYTRKR